MNQINIQYYKTKIGEFLQLAKDINNEKAIRAVASVNGANSIGLIIPCHRIIGSDGGLVGYAGGLSVKKRLIKLEQEIDDENQSSK
jgi:methylated-DNA-[protein]-cysteine S-methyltransferase